MSATETDQSIEERAAAEADEPTGQQPIPGTAVQLSLDAGGESPESASMKLRGGSVPIEGEFPKGSLVGLWIEVRIGEVTFADTIDKFGNVTGTERRHVGRITRVQRA